METPDFRSYFLIRIKLARTVNEIHGDLLSTFPDSCPGLSTSRDGTLSLIRLFLPWRRRPVLDVPGMGFTCKPRRVSITALPAGTTTNRNTMIEYLRTTGKRFLSLKKDKIRLKDCLLLWDNARPHTATDNREFLTGGTWNRETATYSPDLNLCDRFLFRKLKHLLREDEFGGHEEATLAVQRAMRRVSEDELYDQVWKLRGTLPRRHCSRRGLCVLIEKFFVDLMKILSFNWSTSLFMEQPNISKTLAKCAHSVIFQKKRWITFYGSVPN
ncbi:Uncharacterized protein FKW44_016830 [Caligus rogercresseyi]|uniref:Uncharacterized protein n=1 Tax=Caligus rogercresseyi TaxID=217165 RepID=A0A7T8H2C8_CALRO|nr:Uncharacterized protein FKW44_016830 [Caligus rogercresseyi]